MLKFYIDITSIFLNNSIYNYKYFVIEEGDDRHFSQFVFISLIYRSKYVYPYADILRHTLRRTFL